MELERVTRPVARGANACVGDRSGRVPGAAGGGDAGRSGRRVRSFSRGRYPELEELGVETCQGDIRDAEAVRLACRAMDVVYHTAAVSGIWGPWEHFYQVNTLGTEHVMQGCQRGAGARGWSTRVRPSVTFDGSDQCGVDESAPYREPVALPLSAHARPWRSSGCWRPTVGAGLANLCVAAASDLGARRSRT